MSAPQPEDLAAVGFNDARNAMAAWLDDGAITITELRNLITLAAGNGQAGLIEVYCHALAQHIATSQAAMTAALDDIDEWLRATR